MIIRWSIEKVSLIYLASEFRENESGNRAMTSSLSISVRSLTLCFQCAIPNPLLHSGLMIYGTGGGQTGGAFVRWRTNSERFNRICWGSGLPDRLTDLLIGTCRYLMFDLWSSSGGTSLGLAEGSSTLSVRWSVYPVISLSKPLSLLVLYRWPTEWMAVKRYMYVHSSIN